MGDRRVLAVADDLTGALEVGARFAEHGLEAAVVTGGAMPAARVAVVDTETRHVGEDAAGAVVRAAVAGAGEDWVVYKKTDSTLRGNIAAELRALRERWPGRRIVYCGAYPALGRTVRGGRLYVNGVALGETEFARDAMNPSGEGDIGALLEGLGAEIVDAETDAEVAAAARRVVADAGGTIAAGPGALAGALAAAMGRENREMASLPRLERVLVVNGSRHAASAAQMAYARAQGYAGWELFDETVEGDGLERARRLGERVAERVREGGFAGLVVFGGDTAYGMHRAMGAGRSGRWGRLCRECRRR
jgi:D-threonate/D-erythronate kinase